MKINQLLEQLIQGNDLSNNEMQNIIEGCMQGRLNEIQLGAFLALMRMKGETVEELTAAALVMRKLAHTIDLGENLIDIVGTGGDGKNTFNVSTISSFVVAACGVQVAKHGNRSVSSSSGSADLLLEAGFELNLSDEALQFCMQQCGIAFLFAPHFHQAMRHARETRQHLGIRTLFNLLGPLLNPAHVSRQVVGVYAPQWLRPVAGVLENLGSTRALVVNSRDGLDEISIAAITDVVELDGGSIKTWQINPKDYDCAHENLDPIIVTTPAQSLALAEEVFSGQHGAARDMILLNSAAALYCSSSSLTYDAAIQQAADAIDSGAARACFHNLRQLTQQKKPHE
jgi:anthranilate phosphoribosyltransferase